jgi:anti-sigma B factor antagonist
MLTASPQLQSAPSNDKFSVAVHPDRDQVVVAPSGELDLVTVVDVERELSDLRAGGFTDIVFDLRRVTFMDSSGLSLLLKHHRAAQAAGHRFQLVEGTTAARRLLEITGTTDIFDYVARR